MNKAKTSKRNIGLVFGEDENDAESLKNIANAINSKLPPIVYCRRPLILIKNRKAAEDRKKNGADVFAVIQAKNVLASVKFVIAHEDCDNIEPAHIELTDHIQSALSGQGVNNIVVAAPAWEMEAWWYLWPEAVAATNSKWKKLTHTGNHGMIQNVKEKLRRDLRHASTRDYEESDSRKISRKVLDSKLINKTTEICNSFSLFKTQVSNL